MWGGGHQHRYPYTIMITTEEVRDAGYLLTKFTTICTVTVGYFKGQSYEILDLQFFNQSAYSGPVRGPLRMIFDIVEFLLRYSNSKWILWCLVYSSPGS